MPAPINTYSSSTDLNIGHVPQGADDNPELYSELLDIHNALEILLTSSDRGGARSFAFIKVTSDYTVTIDDKLILVDTAAGDITITLPKIDGAIGYDFEVVQIAGNNETLILGDSASEKVDDDPTGITIDLLEALPVKNDGANWWINN